MAQNPTPNQVYAYNGAQSTGKGVIYDALGNAVAIGAQMPVGAGAGNVVTSDASGNLTLAAPAATSLPLTTLGDTLYEDATPTPVRLAGNTSATKNFLTQTGTGAISAAPAWGTIAAADLPTGTTSTKGALQLDGTASDIANTGTQAAGSVGKPADAGHVHFSSGMFLCAPAQYAPAAQQTLTVTGATLAAFTVAATTVAAGSNGGQISLVASWSSPSAGVLAVATTTGWPAAGTVTVAASGATTAIVTYTGIAAGQLTGCQYVSGSPSGTVSTGGAVTLTSSAIYTGPFTAPASGSVFVTASFVAQTGTGVGSAMVLGIAAHATTTAAANVWTFNDNNTGIPRFYNLQFLVTGLTPGASTNFDLIGANGTGGSDTVQILAIGQTASGTTRGAPALMTVQGV